MYKWLNISFLILAVLSAWCLTRAITDAEHKGTGPGEPPSSEELRLHIEKDSCHLGSVQGGTSHKAAVPVKNPTRNMLKIVNLQPGCGCMAADARKSPLAPGEASFIDVTVKAKEQGGSLNVGCVVEVEDASGQRARQQILITADVYPAGLLSCMPGIINFGSVNRGDRPQRTAELDLVSDGYQTTGTKLEVTSAPTGVTCELSFSEGRGTLGVTLDCRIAEPFGAGEIRVRDTHAPEIFCDVPVSWRFRTWTTATPAAVIADLDQSHDSAARIIRLKRNNDESLQIIETRTTEHSKDSGIQVTARANGDASVRVEWQCPSESCSTYTGLIEVDVQSIDSRPPRVETLQIPIVLRRKPLRVESPKSNRGIHY